MTRHMQRGSTTVEFAISALLMLVMLFGIMECGLLAYTSHAVAFAARQGSRWAMVRGTDCVASSCPATPASVKDFVLAQLPLLDTSKATVNTTWSSGSGCTASSSDTAAGPGCTVAVQVSYPFQLTLGFIPISGLTLSSTSTMVISE